MSLNQNQPNQFRTSIGGQALMEGIMMRGPKRTVVACRLPDKRIETVDIEQTLLQERYPILKKPFIRGVVNMVQSFIIGFKALGISADFMATDETVEQSKFDKWCEEHFGDKLMGAMVGIAGF
ncbi:MAG: DUF1385 domain-containing protein, partial [Gemmiger formicilis]|nr:DUF1385 domain-containing protein [Gemmiger formicilis]